MLSKLVFFGIVPAALLALEGYLPEEAEEPIRPWFTGPLITSNPNVISEGHYNIEPYLYGTAYTAFYDDDWHANSSPTFWSVSPQIYIQVGILSWLDVQFVPVLYWNYTAGAGNWALGDLSAQFDAQFHRNQLPHKSWLPSIKFTLKETAPLGKYRNFNPAKKDTQLGGQGAWVTTAALTFGKMIHFSGYRFLHSRLSIACGYSAPIHLKGFNACGGAFATNGTFYSGLQTEADLAFEYSFTRHWAFALDLQGIWIASSRFQGMSGLDFEGVPAYHGLAPAIQYNVAPAIEYNWSYNLGLIAGVWFTVAGKNIPKFTNGVIALNYFK